MSNILNMNDYRSAIDIVKRQDVRESFSYRATAKTTLAKLERKYSEFLDYRDQAYKAGDYMASIRFGSATFHIRQRIREVENECD